MAAPRQGNQSDNSAAMLWMMQQYLLLLVSLVFISKPDR